MTQRSLPSLRSREIVRVSRRILDHPPVSVDGDYAELQRKMKIMDSDRQKFAKHADSEIGKEAKSLEIIQKENTRLQKEAI